MQSFRVKLLVLVVLTLAFLAYSFLLYTDEPREDVQAGPLAKEGKMIWQQKNCQACHQFYGLGGHLGPDLTNVSAKLPDVSIRAFLTSGTNIMPDFHLSEHEKDALVAFLKYTNTTGTADPKSFIRHPDGTISQK